MWTEQKEQRLSKYIELFKGLGGRSEVAQLTTTWVYHAAGTV